MSRFSQRVSEGPARKISETEISCGAPNHTGVWSANRTATSTPIAARMAPVSKPQRTGMRPSQPIKCNPKRRITAPAKGASRFLFCSRNWPTALAEAPKAMNTTEKPMTNANAEVSRLPRGRSPWRNCSTPMPESIEMYPGTSGRTHGERNEIIPATNAARIETCIGCD